MKDASTIVRAIELPIVGPVGTDWPKLRELLSVCWAESTGAANWAVTELRRNDYDRKPADAKLPKMPEIDLYKLAGSKGMFQEIGSQSLATLTHQIRGKYVKARLATVWRHEQSLPDFRYPYPFPVSGQGWRPYFDAQGRPCVEVKLTRASERIHLLLRSGKEFARQMGRFRMIADGSAKFGELSIYRRRCTDSDHRNGIEDREPGGGQRQAYRIIVKMVVRLPRPAVSDGEHTLLVRTDPNAFWVAELEGRQPWILNADHIRRGIEAHRVYRQRMAEDLKAERRLDAGQRQMMLDALDRRCRKQGARLTGFAQQSASSLVEYAHRNRVREIVYDDAAAGYLSSFPWFAIKTMIATKCEDKGIRFTSKDVTIQGKENGSWEKPQAAMEQIKTAKKLIRRRNRGASQSHDAVSMMSPKPPPSPPPSSPT